MEDWQEKKAAIERWLHECWLWWGAVYEDARELWHWSVETALWLHGWALIALDVAGWIVVGLNLQTALWLLLPALLRPFGMWSPRFVAPFTLLPWRAAFRGWLSLSAWLRTHGRSPGHFAGVLEVASLLWRRRRGEILLGNATIGHLPVPLPIAISDEKPLVMVASTGVGKSTSLITQIATTPKRSPLVVLDPKGELAATVAGPHDIVLDPFGLVKGRPSAVWNPLTEIERAAARATTPEEKDGAVYAFASKLVYALVPQNPAVKDPFWDSSARDVVLMLILAVATMYEEESRDLVSVYALLTSGHPLHTPGDAEAADTTLFGLLLAELAALDDAEGYAGLFAADRASPGIRRIVASLARTILEQPEKTRGGILTTARSALSWLNNPALTKILRGRSTFSFEQLKATPKRGVAPLRVYLAAPATALSSSLKGYARAFVTMSLQVLESMGAVKAPTTRFIIDEAPSLGKIDVLATSFPLLRGAGAAVTLITQDIPLLQSVYGKELVQTMLGNCEAVCWMGSSDPETLALISRMLGPASRHRRGCLARLLRLPFLPLLLLLRLFSLKRGLFRMAWDREDYREDTEEKPLMSPEAVRQFLAASSSRMIVTRGGGKLPFKAAKMPYYRHLAVWQYRDSRVPDRLPRRVSRHVLHVAGGACRSGLTALRGGLRGLRVVRPRPVPALPPPPVMDLEADMVVRQPERVPVPVVVDSDTIREDVFTPFRGPAPSSAPR